MVKNTAQHGNSNYDPVNSNAYQIRKSNLKHCF